MSKKVRLRKIEEQMNISHELPIYETKTLQDIQRDLTANGKTYEPWNGKSINPNTFLPPIWKKIREEKRASMDQLCDVRLDLHYLPAT